MTLNDFLAEGVRQIVVAALTRQATGPTIMRVMPLLRHGDVWRCGHVLASDYVFTRSADHSRLLQIPSGQEVAPKKKPVSPVPHSAYTWHYDSNGYGWG